MDDDMALGAIVYPAVQIDVINQTLWPEFPYQRLDDSIDVWMPMAYFTFRDDESGYRDAFRYSDESVARLREHLDDDEAEVHLIGGLADLHHAGRHPGLPPRGAAYRLRRVVGVRLRDHLLGRLAVSPGGRRRRADRAATQPAEVPELWIGDRRRP